MSLFEKFFRLGRTNPPAASISALRLDGPAAQFSTDGTLVEMNGAFATLIGAASVQDVTQAQAMLRSAQRAPGAGSDTLWQDLQAGKPVSDVLRHHPPGGAGIWLQLQYLPVFSHTGNVENILAIADDVSVRRQVATEAQAIVNAVQRSFAVIEFDPTGTVLTANDAFLNCVGYTLSEIKGRKHAMLLPPKEVQSPAYASFWKDLAGGKFQSGEFRRLGKAGKDIWLQASYNPVFDDAGKVVKVVKFAFDITEQKAVTSDALGKVAGLGKSQAIIEFDMSGKILTANEVFLGLLGYTLDEVRGKHHSIFVTAEETGSPEYKTFWQALNAGRFFSSEYARKTKSGGIVWIQATYNPVFDIDGNPVKVVKFATDVTHRKSAIKALQGALAKLAQGDLVVSLNKPFSEEYEPLRNDFNKTRNSLANTIMGIVSAVEALNSGAADIASASDDLARRTEGQAASLEETAAALAEMTNSVGASAKTSSQAHQATTAAIERANQSGAIMQDALTAMGEIESSSGEISKILRVIDDIAFQTNLLALNAGVEAARAGDAGRGFAVVAAEVRALAVRSGEAAREIRALIDTSVNQVTKGGVLLENAGTALSEIVSAFQNIGGLISDIAASSNGQSVGLTELNNAVSRLDQITQRNAAIAEESTAAIQAVRDETNTLASSVSHFALPGHSGAASRSSDTNDMDDGSTPVFSRRAS